MQYPERPSTHILQQWRAAPRVSFEDILRLADPVKEFEWRREVSLRFYYLFCIQVLYYLFIFIFIII